MKSRPRSDALSLPKWTGLVSQFFWSKKFRKILCFSGTTVYTEVELPSFSPVLQGKPTSSFFSWSRGGLGWGKTLLLTASGNSSWLDNSKIGNSISSILANPILVI